MLIENAKRKTCGADRAPRALTVVVFTKCSLTKLLNIIHLQSQLFTTGGGTNYSQGFGQKGNEDRKATLWLGLERLAAITNSGKWQLLIKVSFLTD